MSEIQPVVHIWGAGVDKSLGMPLAGELLGEIANFANGEGKAIADAIRSHLPRLRFSFARYTGEQGETLAERILAEDPQTMVTAKNVLDRYLEIHPGENSDRIRAVRSVVGALENIRDNNTLDDETLGHLAAIAGESFQASGGDHIINPHGIHLVPVVRQAFRRTFQGLAQSEDLTDDERETLTAMALAMMNVEELLGDLFSGFYTRKLSDQKQYLYVGWILWAYLRLKMEAAMGGLPNSPYQTLNALPDDHHVITLNYTASFVPDGASGRVNFFHGDCLSYIRLDTRDLIQNDEKMLNANSVESIAEFIKNLPISVESGKILLPGIVPPLSVKPVMCREHLDTWFRCGQLIDQARAIFVTGYSFGLADEHFNDLLRKRRGITEFRMVVVNPDIDVAVVNVCGLLGRDTSTLTDTQREGLPAKQGGNLLFLGARAEQMTPDVIQRLIE